MSFCQQSARRTVSKADFLQSCGIVCRIVWDSLKRPLYIWEAQLQPPERVDVVLEEEEGRSWVVDLAGGQQKARPRPVVAMVDNEDVEPAKEKDTTGKRRLKTALTKYFNLGVQTSDPLLTVAKWIAYVTEVSFVMS